MKSLVTRYTKCLSSLTCVCFVSFACSHEKVQTSNAKVGMYEHSTQALKLAASDSIMVRVYEDDSLDGEYQLAPDGSIDMPLLGRLVITGKDTTQVADMLQTHLLERQFLKQAHVQVTVKSYASKQVSVVGSVNKPGTYSVFEAGTVIQAVGQAGGLSSLASANQALLTRVSNTERQTIRVKLEDILEGRSRDIPLQPGDQLFIPERVF